MAEDSKDSAEGTTRGSESSVARAMAEAAGEGIEQCTGDVIGRYRLIEIIGVGGFGVVWLAEQVEPVRRRVALKVIKPGMDSRPVIARFEAERQALALMSHPNVAKVLDAGTTPAGPGGAGGGRPYFVMEHVKGVAITEYCDRERLTVEQRLGLFAVVCDAVQHAHMRGIIHRDLKPSNILVTITEEGGPRPVVIDFGVAKALAGRLTDAPLHTERGVLIGTPEYMSPEQAESNESEIDTRTDVYSLGVILYELLTGTLPFDPKDLRSRGQVELQRFIRETEPPRPSTRLSTMGGLTAAAAAARSMKIDELESLLRKELEWIPLKAMRKDRAERYRSASEMGDDIGNYLEDRPLIAGPESAGYRARKFVRRNKGAVVAGCLVAASLVIGAGVAVWFGMSEATARRGESAALAASRASEDRARQISKFVVDALQSSDPNAGGRQDTTVAQAMRGAIAEIDSGAFSRDPTTEADLRETIGEILLHNGQPAESAGQFERALGLRRRGAGGSHELAVSLNNLGTAQIALGKFGEAEKNIRESLELHRHEPTVDEAAVASNLDNIGIALQGQEKFEGALQSTTEALGIYRRLHPGHNADVARSLTNIGYVLRSLGRLEEAGDKLSESLTMLRRLHPEGHPDVALCLNGLAGVRRMMGRLDEAEPLYREALEMRRRAYKGDHPDVAASLANFGMFLASRGRPAEAVPLLREALEMDRRMLPRDHTDTLTCMNNLGAVLLDTKAYGEAEGLFDEALGMSRRLAKEKNLGEDNEDTANALMGLGRARQGLGKRDEARTALDESVAIQRRMAGTEQSYGLVRALYRSGCVRLENGEKDAARRDLEEAVVIGEKVLGAGDPQLKVFREAVEKCK